MSFPQAIILGLLQGVTELFPVSSLGHSVILPAFLGWTDVVAAQQASESYFLAFLVGLHVATALALAWFFRRRLAADHLGPARLGLAPLDRHARRPPGLAAHRGHDPGRAAGRDLRAPLRVVFAKPLLAGFLLFINGLILLAGERLRRRPPSGRRRPLRLGPPARTRPATAGASSTRSSSGRPARSASARSSPCWPASAAPASRWSPGCSRGLDHEDAARFSFLLATPIILAAGVYKLPDLLGPNGAGVQGQVLAGSVAAAIAAYLSVRFLSRYFETRTLTPFAIYCLVAGLVTVVRFH